MTRWKLFNKSKIKEEEKTKPQETVKEDAAPEPETQSSEEQNLKEEEEILVEYKETLYTSSQAAKKVKSHAISDQRIWRDMESIEKNIDTMDVKKVVKPVEKLEEKVDNIISRRKEKKIPSPKKPPNVIYVVSKPQPGQVKGDWAVRGHGKIYSHHRLKESAITQARKIAKQKGATVLIQNIDGTFSGSYKPKQKK
jgi:hypothetical protein